MFAILRDWFPTEFEGNPDLDRVAAMLLQDLYVQPEFIVNHRPKTIAVLVISMAFTALKLDIPDEAWVPTLNSSLEISKLQRLKTKVLEEVYQK